MTSGARPNVAAAIAALDELTRRLRRECPWDREQDERSIVPHTVEEAYELAAAAHDGDDARLLDELGDVLFQVHFLSLLLEERGAGTMADVAEHCRRKLIRRHPHVFPDQAGFPDQADSVGARGTGAGARGTGPDQAGFPDQADSVGARGTGAEVKVESAGDVLRNWDAIKRTEAGREPGIFGEVPENLPGPLYARKVQRRAASTGLDVDHVPYDALRGALDALEAAGEDRFDDVGDVLFAAVNVARKLKVDPELALRAASDRFRGRVEGAEGLAASDGADWNDLGPEAQLAYYARARLAE